MKNRKSALRKAVMAAMLAGAITTTGGVKAEGKRNPAIPQLLLAISKVKENRSDDLLEKLADVFANLGEYEMRLFLEGAIFGEEQEGLPSDYQLVLQQLKTIGGSDEDDKILFRALVDGIQSRIEFR